jgi:hypothetical protein
MRDLAALVLHVASVLVTILLGLMVVEVTRASRRM